MCSMVSKQFCSFVLRTRIATIKMLLYCPCPEESTTNNNQSLISSIPRKLLGFFTNTFRLQSENPSLILKRSVMDFLKKFNSIDTLEIQLLFPTSINKSIIRWEATYDKTLMMSNCNILLVDEYNDDDEDEDFNQDGENNGDDYCCRHPEENLAGFIYENVQVEFHFLCGLAREGVKFRKALITDAQNYGEFFLGEEQIEEMKGVDSVAVISRTVTGAKFRCMSTFRLLSSATSSGHFMLMKGVRLLVFKRFEVEAIWKDTTQGEEEDFAAVVRRILDEHPQLSVV